VQADWALDGLQKLSRQGGQTRQMNMNRDRVIPRLGECGRRLRGHICTICCG
jgi:hypothetical protein